MSFINGLKNIFKKPIFAIIVVIFIIEWILILLAATFIPYTNFIDFLIVCVGYLGGFTLILLIFSFFSPLEKMSKYVILIALIITIPFLLIFTGFVSIFYAILLISNQFLTAFFYFKLCMDYSTKLDDWLYTKKKSRIFTRIIEFVLFGILVGWILRILMLIFQAISVYIFNIFLVLLIVDIILAIFVIVRLIFTKKFSAYITLFFLLALFYVIYIIIDAFAGELLSDPSSISWYSFIIDLALFLYMIGSIYDKVDYLKERFNLRADTIGLFVILMKLTVQAINLPTITVILPPLLKEIGLLIIFVIITLIFGIYSIFVHKEGKTKK